ncbi:aspartate dehydrogenase [Amorphus sp. 3PC139-8]|uniref:aspartate dehydrogenase n=1 Tax=Amorphus sp. 3PC139-8 TaxID=2735676 RepID=UPI00345CED6E
MRRLAILGHGNIAATLVDVLGRDGRARFEAVSVLARPGAIDRARESLAGKASVLADEVTFYDTLEGLLTERPCLAVECATHSVVRDTVPAVLRAGCETVIVSIGAFADPEVADAVEDAAASGQTRAVLVPGAIGGVDALAAAKLAGIETVVYTGRKPPAAWRGTPAENALDLDQVAEPIVFFEGTARRAASDFPKNANVAATLALAGPGFDATRVRLVADPTIGANVHEYEVRSASVNFSIRLEGKASPDNPKTSVSTVYSVAREVLNRIVPIAI